MGMRWRAGIVAAALSVVLVAPFGSMASASTLQAGAPRAVTPVTQLLGCPAPVGPRVIIYPPTGTTLGVSISIVTPGGTITIHGTGYAPGIRIIIYLCSQVTQVGTATADASGAFTTTVTIPASTPLGAHELAASGTAFNGGPLVQVADISVVAASPTSATVPTNVGPVSQPTSPSGPVAFTGIYAVRMILVGLVLVLSGTALVLGVRRRRLA